MLILIHQTIQLFHTPQEVLVTPFTSIFDGTSFDNLTQPNGGADY